MRTLAIMNEKGGTAKTTTAVNLARALALRRKRVLVLDMDPQAHASSWLGITTGDRAILDALTGSRALSELVQSTSAEGVDAVPSSSWLASADRIKGVGPDCLSRALAALPQSWDVVLVDCPPQLGLLSVSALAACAAVLVPCETHTLALTGLARLTESIAQVKERLNPTLAMAGILACRVDGRTRLAAEVIAALRQRFDSTVFRSTIRENVRLAEAPSHALAIHDYAPSSTGAADYSLLATELLARYRRQ